MLQSLLKNALFHLIQKPQVLKKYSNLNYKTRQLLQNAAEHEPKANFSSCRSILNCCYINIVFHLFHKVSTCQDALGMESGAISDAQITASSQFTSHYHHAANQGRLHFQQTGIKRGAWSAASNNARQWLQVDLSSHDYRITGVATQGRNSTTPQQWVTKYKLQYSNDAVTFWCYREQGTTTDKVKIAQRLHVQHMRCFVIPPNTAAAQYKYQKK